MSNYPPGVTGNEYQIAGPDWEEEIFDTPCPKCGAVDTLWKEGFRGTITTFCDDERGCGEVIDVVYPRDEDYDCFG